MITESVTSQIAAFPVAVANKQYNHLARQDRLREGNRDSFAEDLERVFGWLSANPSNEDRVRQFKDLYLPFVYDFGGSEKQDFVDRLTDELLDDAPTASPSIKVVGKRGAGKTALINYLLTTQFSRLQGGAVTWFRVDVAKLHILNSKRLAPADGNVLPELSVNQYLARKALAVILTYWAKDAVFANAFGNFDHIVDGGLKAGLSEELAQTWDQVKTFQTEHLARRNPARSYDPSFQDLIWYINQFDLSGISARLVTDLYCAVWAYITTSWARKHAQAPRLLIVFDGVDNLRVDEHAPEDKWLAHRSAREWYRTYLRQLNEYLQGDGRCLPHGKCIFLIRSDTHVEMESDVRTVNGYEQRAEPRVYRLKTPDFNKIFLAKVAFTRQSGNHCHMADEHFVKAERLALFEWFYKEYVNQHIIHLRGVLGQPYQGGISDSANINEVIDVVFNGNIRSLSRNLIRSFEYMFAFARTHQSYRRAQDNQEREAVLKDECAKVIFEGSVLSGKPFMASNEAADYIKGRWCPNLFEFLGTTDRRWDGLAIIRVLQAVPLAGADAGLPTLTEIQTDMSALGYPGRESRVAVWMCLEFGLLELGDSLYVESTGQHELMLRKTRKGEYVMKLALSDWVVAYLCATGTRFFGIPDAASYATQRDNRFIHFIDDGGGEARRFIASVMRTDMMLVRHLISAHRRDMKALNHKLRSDEERLAQLKSVFCEPPTNKIVEQIQRAIDTFDFKKGNPNGDEREFMSVVKEWETMLRIQGVHA